MSSFRMRYFFLAPLVVLAMVACAKRDSDFSKRAADKAAAEKLLKDKDGAPPGPSVSPGDSLNPSPSPEVSPADDSEDGDTDHLYQESCKIPTSLEMSEEKTLDYEKLINDEEGSYVLQSTEFYVDRPERHGKLNNQLHITGSQYALTTEFSKNVSDSGKITVVCHTVKADEASTQKISESMILPNEISTKDGSVKILRQDKVDIDHKAVVKVESTLYAEKFSLKKLMAEAEGQEKQIVKVSKDTITIKLKAISSDEKTGDVTTIIKSGTYIKK